MKNSITKIQGKIIPVNNFSNSISFYIAFSKLLTSCNIFLGILMFHFFPRLFEI